LEFIRDNVFTLPNFYTVADVQCIISYVCSSAGQVVCTFVFIFCVSVCSSVYLVCCCTKCTNYIIIIIIIIIEQNHSAQLGLRVAGFPGYWVTKCDPVPCLTSVRRRIRSQHSSGGLQGSCAANSLWRCVPRPAGTDRRTDGSRYRLIRRGHTHTHTPV